MSTGVDCLIPEESATVSSNSEGERQSTDLSRYWLLAIVEGDEMASGATMDEEKKRILPEVTLEESYKICDRWVADRLKPYAWMGGNIASGSRRYFHAVLALAARTEKMCDIHVGRAARLDQLADFREDFRNNFMEEESTDQFPALLDTVKRFGIPQQYLHDIVLAADMCGRIERFQNFDQWLQLGLSLIHI